MSTVSRDIGSAGRFRLVVILFRTPVQWGQDCYGRERDNNRGDEISSDPAAVGSLCRARKLILFLSFRNPGCCFRGNAPHGCSSMSTSVRAQERIISR